LLEQVVDLLLRHAALAPAFPDRSQDLLEGLRRGFGARDRADMLFEDLLHILRELSTVASSALAKHLLVVGAKFDRNGHETPRFAKRFHADPVYRDGLDVAKRIG
jgi:hypothetical protein